MIRLADPEGIEIIAPCDHGLPMVERPQRLARALVKAWKIEP